jgi:hypothetical protein
MAAGKYNNHGDVRGRTETSSLYSARHKTRTCILFKVSKLAHANCNGHTCLGTRVLLILSGYLELFLVLPSTVTHDRPRVHVSGHNRMGKSHKTFPDVCALDNLGSNDRTAVNGTDKIWCKQEQLLILVTI